ncbi:uncharacterized protein BYT42DRAFT_636404 [Radiomyces spectabilis]|uniref:uncharacterized protein n=1 Tax=Radiomyces spectabilis TaxID=64574 RepID=UPI00222017D5|nr:uncharacterized protein BYT42DRAFT_636404 [Radiomyces spectabilis]KAI8379707.1 hypothetical protein BYT42DRAFT_636404 [Radiomyces spectabilis]
MLKPKVIAQVLRQATHNGVRASLLMTSEGSLLAFAADNDKCAKTYAAIAANVWSTYKKQPAIGTSLDNNILATPRFLLLQCEEGTVFVTSIGAMLLCLVGEESVDLGLLRAKADALRNHLDEPLQKVASYQDY